MMQSFESNTSSAPFRQVEDWLRSLGLICFAQAFYDNGYEDLEICKQISEDDLNVIGVTNVKDRNDILAGVVRLKQKAVYFELEPDDETILVTDTQEDALQKFEPFFLLTRVKAEIENDHVDLTQPPYFYPDGSFGDLSSLAQRLSYSLLTYENDVLSALSQLRRRQLPANSYNDVAEMMQNQREQEIRSKKFVQKLEREEPEDYLNVEVPYRRSTSISKHDKRITKSTTNIFEAVSDSRMLSKKRTGHEKQRKPVMKSQSVYDKQSRSFLSSLSMLKRTASGGTSGKIGTLNMPIPAKDITLGQDELISLMTKVKLGEITQESVLDQVNEHYRKSVAFDVTPPSSPDYRKPHLSRKEIKRQEKKEKKRVKTISKKPDFCGNSHFYTFGFESSDKSAEESSVVEHQVDDISQLEHSSISNASQESPKSTGDEMLVKNSSSPSGGQGGVCETMGEKYHINRSKTPPAVPNRVESQVTKRSGEKRDSIKFSPSTQFAMKNIPPIPPSRNIVKDHSVSSSNQKLEISTKTSENFQASMVIEPTSGISDNMEFASFGKHGCSKTFNSKKQEKNLSFTSVKDPCNKSHSIQAEDVLHETRKPVPPPRTFSYTTDEKVDPRGNRQGDPVRPIVPPRKRRNASRSDPKDYDGHKTSLSETLCSNIGLEPAVSPCDISNSVESFSSSASNCDKSLGKQSPIPLMSSSAASFLPVPPRPKNWKSISKNISCNGEKPPCSNSEKLGGEQIIRKKRPLKDLILKKLKLEDIDLTRYPYSLQDGVWNVPVALVTRYAVELNHQVSDVAACMDGLRINLLKEQERPYKLCCISEALKIKFKKADNLSVTEWLISIGLPMFVDGFCYLGLCSLDELYSLTEEEVFGADVYEPRHIEHLFQRIKEMTPP